MYHKRNCDEGLFQYKSFNWEELFSANAEDPDSMLAKFIALYNEAVDKFIPAHLCKLNDGSTRSKYPKDVIQLIKKKSRLWQRYLETIRNEISFSKYTNVRNKVKNEIRHLKIYKNQKQPTKLKIIPKNVGHIYISLKRKLN